MCAEALQSDLLKIKGITDARVEYLTQTVTLEYETDGALLKAVKTTNKFEQVRVVDGVSDLEYVRNHRRRDGAKRAHAHAREKKSGTHLQEWLRLAVSALFFIVGVALDCAVGGKAAQTCAYACYGLAYFAVGYPVLLSTAKNLVKGRIFDENFLMTVASIGAVALGEMIEGVAVMLLYQLGELLQSIAVGSSRGSVARLMELKSERATLLIDGEQKEVRPEEVKVGDTVLVKAGEKAPTDGVLLDERAILDEKSLTGEAQPVTVLCGEEIPSGSINVGGVYEMKVLRPYEDSAVARILELVENAAAGKAKPEKFISKFAKIYTPVVCLLAVALAVFAPLFSGVIAYGEWYFRDVARWVRTALTLLVISCPCALVISVPLTYFSGIGACARKGVLVKGAGYLDILAQANAVAFDKTGTLTEGNFTLREARPQSGTSKEELLQLIAAVERGSAHPIAKAFDGIESPFRAEEIAEISGRGLTAVIDGATLLVGGEKLLTERGVQFERVESAYTVVYAAKGGRYLGSVEIGDTLRRETGATVRALRDLGISRTVMLTGDGERRARAIAEEIGVDEVRAGLLPDGKWSAMEELKKRGKTVYVGDGVNDAPVMTAADCAVSMGKLGSAAAVEASDLVLISDDLSGLPSGIKIAKKTRKIVWQNVAFSIVMKVAFMALGVAGTLPLWLAVFADVGVMLLAVANALRARK